MTEIIKNVVKNTISKAYDRPMVLAFVNLSWFALILFIVPIGPATLGVYYFAHKLQEGGSVHFRDFLDGLKKYWVKGVLLSFVQLSVFAILAVDWYFLLYSSFVADLGLIFQVALYVFCFYLSIFFLILSFYVYPLLVNTNNSILFAYRQAAFLLFKFPVFSLSVSFINTLFLILSAIFPPILMLFFMGVSSLLGDSSLVYLMNDELS